MSEMPRFTLEAVAFGGMLLITLYFMTLSLYNKCYTYYRVYAFAGYRLMSALQKIFVNLTVLRFVGPALDSYIRFKKFKLVIPGQNQKLLKFSNAICLKNINYNYPSTARTALKITNNSCQ